jgi:hypothetical protein
MILFKGPKEERQKELTELRDWVRIFSLCFSRIKLTTVACIMNIMTIVNYASSTINKLEASLSDDARVIIYDCHAYIIQATADVFDCFEPLQR